MYYSFGINLANVVNIVLYKRVMWVKIMLSCAESGYTQCIIIFYKEHRYRTLGVN